MTQEHSETFLELKSRIVNTYKRLHEKEHLSGADEAIIVEVYIKALRNQGVRKQLRLEDISLENLLQRSNLIRQVEETSERTNHESGHLIESIYNMMVQTKKCENCGLSHETSDCLASPKLQAKWRKQTGTGRDMKFNDFSSRRVPPREVTFQPNNNNQFSRNNQNYQQNDNQNLSMSFQQNHRQNYPSNTQQQPSWGWKSNQNSWNDNKSNQPYERRNNFSGNNNSWQGPRPRQGLFGEFHRSFNQPKQHMYRGQKPSSDHINSGQYGYNQPQNRNNQSYNGWQKPRFESRNTFRQDVGGYRSYGKPSNDNNSTTPGVQRERFNNFEDDDQFHTSTNMAASTGKPYVHPSWRVREHDAISTIKQQGENETELRDSDDDEKDLLVFQNLPS